MVCVIPLFQVSGNSNVQMPRRRSCRGSKPAYFWPLYHLHILVDFYLLLFLIVDLSALVLGSFANIRPLNWAR